MLESTRAKEEAVKKETAEQLDLFRRQQEEADKALLTEVGDTSDPSASGKTGSALAAESEWAINARKRKRAKEKEGLKGIKFRKSSVSEIQMASATSDTPAGNSAPTVISKEPNAVSKFPVPKDADSIKSMPPSKSHTTPSSKIIAIQGKATRDVLPGLGLAGYSSDED